MVLRELISGLDFVKLAGSSNVRVSGIAYDSRKVKENFLFACLPGAFQDGHSFAGEAVRKGASCVLCQRDAGNGKVPRVIVKDSRRALSYVSAKFYGFPSESMHVAGITGTNGKTSVACLCESIAKEAGMECGVIGTVNYRWGQRILPAGQTTPESLDTQSILNQMRDSGCGYVFMEVSSHGLVQRRVDDICFKTAVFTNLSPEHMDFHKDMEDYFKAKSRLFSELLDPGGCAVLNADDDYAVRIAGIFPGRKLTYGLGADADVSAGNMVFRDDGSDFELSTPAGKCFINLKLPGKGNIYNSLAAACFGLARNTGLDTIKAALERVENIKGRFEVINRGGDFTVVVDYAHTPSALDLLLSSAREICSGKIITVFGCGGDRDKFKRPAMGETAAAKSDFTVLTTDNPRSEDPMAIISDIEQGFKKSGAGNYCVIGDRKEAIRYAVARAGKNDFVLIAGKGHETYQVFENTVIPFSDADVAREALTDILALRAR